MANRKPAKKAVKKTAAKKEYERTWRPASKSSEGPKKRSPRNPYKDTWRPASKASEGPKKRMPRAKKK